MLLRRDSLPLARPPHGLLQGCLTVLKAQLQGTDSTSSDDRRRSVTGGSTTVRSGIGVGVGEDHGELSRVDVFGQEKDLRFAVCGDLVGDVTGHLLMTVDDKLAMPVLP